MKDIFELPVTDLNEIFIQTAFKMSLGSPTIIEKDYWVVWLLRCLFSENNFSKHHVFKGGTSLSKCFGLIQRFSEDLDITISKKALGLNETLEEVGQLGSKKRKKYFEHLASVANEHVDGIHQSLSEKIGSQLSGLEWNLYIDSDNKQNIIFEYPKALESTMYPDDSYVKPKILLEFGCRGELEPSSDTDIVTYIEEYYKDIFTGSTTSVKAMKPERTFWEKITLLHMLAHQAEDKKIQLRIARHYYDVYKLSTAGIAKNAITNLSLLDSVAAHKSIYFRSKQASYDTAKPGSLKLIPNQWLLKQINDDYLAMEDMFFGDVLSFDEIINEVTCLEDTINNLG